MSKVKKDIRKSLYSIIYKLRLKMGDDVHFVRQNKDI